MNYNNYFRLVDTDHKITMDLEWKTPLETYGELKGYRVRYGRINANQLTDILITDPNVHHQEISGLEKGIEYEFRVAGVNTVGPGQETIKYYLTPEGKSLYWLLVSYWSLVTILASDGSIARAIHSTSTHPWVKSELHVSCFPEPKEECWSQVADHL